MLGLACALATVLIPTAASAETSAAALFAAEHAAVGGDAWAHVSILRTRGEQVAGDAPGGYYQVVDRGTGHTRTATVTGAFRDDFGFDGDAWDAQNGIITIIDLPSLRRDAVTQSYIAKDG